MSNKHRKNAPPLTRFALVGAIAASILPALCGPVWAAYLSNWRFDPQRRQLEFTLPPGASPTYSLTSEPAPRLIVNISDTQVGTNVTELYPDSVVRKVSLKEVAPEQARIIIEFAPDAILSPDPVQLQRVGSGNSWLLRPLIAQSAGESLPLRQPSPNVEVRGTRSPLFELPPESNQEVVLLESSDRPVEISVPRVEATATEPPFPSGQPQELANVGFGEPLPDSPLQRSPGVGQPFPPSINPGPVDFPQPRPLPANQQGIDLRQPLPLPANQQGIDLRQPLPLPANQGPINFRQPLPLPANQGPINFRQPLPQSANQGPINFRQPLPQSANQGPINFRQPLPQPVNQGPINFRQPLPASGNQGSLRWPEPLPTDSPLERSLLVLKEGDTLELVFPRGDNIVLPRGIELQEVLLLRSPIVDRFGRIVVPAKTPVIGGFESTRKGSRFIARALFFQGRTIPLAGRSDIIEGRRRVDLMNLAGASAVGGLALLLLTDSGLGLLGGAAAGAGAAYATSPKAVTLEPAEVVKIRLTDDLTQSVFLGYR